MNPFQITALVFFGGGLLVGLMVAAAWLHHLWAHRERHWRNRK